MTKRAVVYARVASAQQSDNGSSLIADQKRAIAAYCQQHGLVIVGEYVDVGSSGITDNRPDFLRMLNDADRGVPAFDLIIVESYSRLFRDNVLAEMYRRRLQKAGIEIVSVSGDRR